MDVSVVIPAHNPHPERLQRVLAALAAQTLSAARWECLLIDNASKVALRPDPGLPQLRVVAEPRLGLTPARRRGFAECRAPWIVEVDDDNVLAPDYLAQVVRLFAAHPRMGAMGGKSLPEFERPPEDWQREFFPLLALRDPGPEAQIARELRPAGSARNRYPAEAGPLGGGMALRREALPAWFAAVDAAAHADRRGDDLTSGGDNDIVFTLLQHGWEVGYFPELSLKHLIPAGRLDPRYLGRLNRGIQKSWMQVLTRHQANPWPAVPAWTVPLRQAKAWFAFRAWSGAAARIRWQGACGHFEGRRAAPAS